MAQSTPAMQFEDIPLDEARRMSRRPRMVPELYHALKEKIASLDNTATRLTTPEGMSTTTMKNGILRVAAELSMPVTVRKVPGGLLFWRSTDEDRQQATEVAAWPQSARQPPHTTRRSRRRRGLRGTSTPGPGSSQMMRRMMRGAIVVVVVMLVVTIGTALALDGHGRLVVIDASPWEVKERCGEPTAIADVMKHLAQCASDPTSHTTVDILVPVQQSMWTDNVGSTRFRYDLTFQEGTRIDITTGDDGHETGERRRGEPLAPGVHHPAHQHRAGPRGRTCHD